MPIQIAFFRVAGAKRMDRNCVHPKIMNCHCCQLKPQLLQFLHRRVKEIVSLAGHSIWSLPAASQLLAICLLLQLKLRYGLLFSQLNHRNFELFSCSIHCQVHFAFEWSLKQLTGDMHLTPFVWQLLLMLLGTASLSILTAGIAFTITGPTHPAPTFTQSDGPMSIIPLSLLHVVSTSYNVCVVGFSG